ncbi:hypothetical protein Nepgr_006997 [Nepenthes gracilis]|uniref:Calcineurin-like phosphoesterase domain-containing protein n=1 Tax=Nepenthes gracilis TaxID=150966 RepID=A0AAD3XHV2_NEPGR|nr:hypothetical protein Nepgr_006997 [Nepenthes gracilis]
MARFSGKKRLVVLSIILEESYLGFLLVILATCGYFGPERVVSAPLRFKPNGEFKILQVADMHYADGKTTPCLDVLPNQFNGCSDLNTTAFTERMIRAENPDLIVFTGDNIFGFDATDSAKSLDFAFAPAVLSNIPWAAVLGNHDQEGTLSREGVMKHIVTMKNVLSQLNPPKVDDIDGFGNYNLEVAGVEGSAFQNKSILNLYFLDSGDYSTVPSIPGYGWIKPSQQSWFERTSKKLRKAYMAKPEPQKASAPGLVYFHIPLPEYASFDSSNFTGVKQEAISSASVNSGFFTTMVEAGDVKAVFTGHDHINDFCGELTGIYLCYGGGFGYHAYGKAGWARRARVVVANLEKVEKGGWGAVKSIKTWKRLDDELLSAIDARVLWSKSSTGIRRKKRIDGCNFSLEFSKLAPIVCCPAKLATRSTSVSPHVHSQGTASRIGSCGPDELLFGPVMTSIKSETDDGEWPVDLDCVPLKLRLKILRVRNEVPNRIDASTCNLNEEWRSTSCNATAGTKDSNSLMLLEHDHARTAFDGNASGFPGFQTSDCSPNSPTLQNNTCGHSVGSSRVFHEETCTASCASSMSPSQESLMGSNGGYEIGANVKHEISDSFDDSLDQIVLRERRRMLLSRMLKQSPKPSVEGKTGGLLSLSSENAAQQSMEVELHDSHSVEGESFTNGDSHPGTYAYDICQTLVPPNSDITGRTLTVGQCSASVSDDYCGADSVESRNSTFADFKSYGWQETLTNKPGTLASPALSSIVRVKVELLDINKPQIQEKGNVVGNFFIDNILRVKNELVLSEEAPVDELDHLPLVDRMKLLSSETSSRLNNSRNLNGLDGAADVLESIKPIRVTCAQKRKKTATCLAETALEEDAPELLKVLIEKGVSIEDIKLYGGIESDDPLDDSLSEDSFADLESVMSQLFTKRQPFLKFAPTRCSKGSKAIYCLACLLSLVEQTQYLRNRRWPVEWGWCRDLQSFIFVFQRHNRIVLERPEYGYATYFFELLDSLPVDWQVKRLVIVMKLTSCGRIALIENKSLLVGEDLSEGEARVLAEYGWMPNTGLGTLLNFCDRVVHDRKNEMDGCEWRSKIAKLLIKGYSGGNIICKDVPKKLVDCKGSQSTQLELKP